MMLQRAQQLPDFQSQLHLLYLVNDIVFSGCVKDRTAAAVTRHVISASFHRQRSRLAGRCSMLQRGKLATLCHTEYVCRLSEGQSTSTQMAGVFQSLLSAFFTQAYLTVQRSSAAYAQLCGLLDLWASRAVYPQAVVDGVKHEMMAQVRSAPVRTSSRDNHFAKRSTKMRMHCLPARM